MAASYCNRAREWAQRSTLKEVGKWLAVNGEPIYGTHNWITDGEGFTRLPARSGRGGGRGRRGGTPPAAATPPAPAPPPAPEPQSPKQVEYSFTVKGDNL